MTTYYNIAGWHIKKKKKILNLIIYVIIRNNCSRSVDVYILFRIGVDMICVDGNGTVATKQYIIIICIIL